jgi:hypothetical protein
MHDLRLVGVHEDGEHLLLSGPGGEQYLLTVDESLRAAVRRDRAHLGQLQIEMSGELRPREVQSQIRAGASAEEVAARCGWPVERVRRYEGAVLAERAHITDLGRAVTLRRRGSDTTPPTLTSRVERRLSERGVDIRQNVWDSWRAESGPWMLTLHFVAGGREREARWIFDQAARTVTAQDDEALWLSEDEKPPAPPQAAPHLSAVPTVTAMPSPPAGTTLYDLDADGGIDPSRAASAGAGRAAGSAEGSEASGPSGSAGTSSVDLIGAMRQRRHGRRRATSEAAADEGSEPTRDQAGAPAGEQEPLDLEPVDYDREVHGTPPAAHPFPFPERVRPAKRASDQPRPPTSRVGATSPPAAAPASASGPSAGAPAAADRASGRSASASSSAAVAPRPRGFGPPPAASSTGPTHAASAPTQPPAHRRARRASVPSWDEIMFGGKRD